MFAPLYTWWWSQSPKPAPSPPSTTPSLTPTQIYWYESLGTFIFVFLQTCTKQPTGIHLQITLILLMAIPMCAKQSGAHYNPAVTISNYLCVYNKSQWSWEAMWMYFKAQIWAAVFALGLGYVLNEHFMPGLALPAQEVTQLRILLSQVFATAVLVFYTQLVANQQTSFTVNDGQKYCFIIAFVFVARRSAHVSSFAINPAITIATLIMDVVTCRFLYLRICSTYLVGDVIGAIFGTLVYNKFYLINLMYSRRHRHQHERVKERYDVQMEVLVPLSLPSFGSSNRMDSNREQQSTNFSRNVIEIDKIFLTHHNSNKKDQGGN